MVSLFPECFPFWSDPRVLIIIGMVGLAIVLGIGAYVNIYRERFIMLIKCNRKIKRASAKPNPISLAVYQPGKNRIKCASSENKSGFPDVIINTSRVADLKRSKRINLEIPQLKERAIFIP